MPSAIASGHFHSAWVGECRMSVMNYASGVIYAQQRHL
jgi:hypothetical protein